MQESEVNVQHLWGVSHTAHTCLPTSLLPMPAGRQACRGALLPAALQWSAQAGFTPRCLLCCRCLLAVRPAEGPSLQRLGKALHEQAAVHYLESARRLIARHAEQRQHLPELNARVSFKVICSALDVWV